MNEDAHKVAQASSLCSFFNPHAPLEISTRNLPHWHQDGVSYFVTFRLADSIPQEKLRQWLAQREDWLRRHPIPHTDKQRQEYHHLFSETIEHWLDSGSGDCLLRNPVNARIVADSLKYFNGVRYRLGEWVVMPNHVHVVFVAIAPHTPSEILHSWKSFTANKINKRTGNSGQLWQHESYDHIIRSEQQLAYINRYIRDNPSKAGIKVTHASSLRVFSKNKHDACPT